MKSSKFAAVLAISAVVCTTAYAADEQQFSALAGVETQEMTAPEMNAVYGQLTIADIRTAISAVTHPPLTDILLGKLNTFYGAHSAQVDSFLTLLTNRSH